MRETLLRELEAMYAQQRAMNRAEEQSRLAKATKKDPQIGRLVAERMAVFSKKARDAFAKPEEALCIGAALKETIQDIQEKLGDALLAAGFPADYLQPVSQCPHCQDTGYVGEPIRERCACFARLMQTVLLGDGDHGLNPRETFAAYDDAIYPDTPDPRRGGDSQRAYMGRLKQRCLDFADRFPDTAQRDMLLVGMSGLGKTYLMNCMGNRVLERGLEAFKLTAYQLTERMRAAIFSQDPEAFSLLLTVPLLLLDDLGAEPLIPNITLEQLFTLLNERANHGLATVISTNLMPDEIKQRYTERVFSRLFDNQSTLLLRFFGKDVRLKG